jgi:Protein of unknown function (DUF1638)
MYALIACGIFQKEIEMVREKLGFSFELFSLDSGLHVDFDMLAGALNAELAKCNSYRGIIIIYGECHPKIREIIRPFKAVLINCQNCVDALITRKGMENKGKDGLYFYLSPGWIEAWRDIFQRLNWDREVARLHLGAFKGAVFLDTLGNAKDYEIELMEFFDYTNLPFEIMPVDLAYFKSLITDAKDCLEA